MRPDLQTNGLAVFLDHPGLPGPFGALMDEYARAAGELCSVIEAVPADRFERELPDPAIEFRSLRSVVQHVARSAYGYAGALRKARSLPKATLGTIEVAVPADLRSHLAGALRSMEGALTGFYDADDATVTALRFEMP